jgi:hypothetical protein
MKRTAASKLGKSPQLDRGGASLPRPRRAESRPDQTLGRPPRRHHRTRLSPAPRGVHSRPGIWARATKRVSPGFEVADDFAEALPVLPGELRVIETYLARLLDDSLEAATMGTDTPATEAPKEDGE